MSEETEEEQSRNVRVRQQDRQTLKKLKEVPAVKQMAVEEGVIPDEDARMSYEDLLRLVIPDDAEVISRPEEEMVWFNAAGMKDSILELAGENVSVHRVIRQHTEEFVNKHGFEVDNE